MSETLESESWEFHKLVDLFIEDLAGVIDNRTEGRIVDVRAMHAALIVMLSRIVVLDCSCTGRDIHKMIDHSVTGLQVLTRARYEEMFGAKGETIQ